MRDFITLVCVLALALGATARADEAKPSAGDNQFARGRVSNISKDTGTFAIKTIEGKELTFHLGDARVRIDGRDTKLADLKLKTRLLVVYRPDGGKNRAVAVTRIAPTGAEVAEQFRQAFQITKSYAYDKKEEFKTVVQGVMSEMNDAVTDAAREIREEGKNVGEAFEGIKKDLAEKADAVNKSLARASPAGAEGWEDAKAEVRKSMEEFERAYERARAKYETKDVKE